MQTAKRWSSAFVLVLLAACAGRTLPPLPASMRVDPDRDVVLIPQDVCPKFGGWIAKTQDAVKLEELQAIEADRAQRLALAECQTGQFLAETQRDQAVSAAESAGFWAKWGFPLGLASGAVVTTLTVLIIKGLEAAYGR